MKISGYPLKNIIKIKSKKNNRTYYACFKKGQLYIEILNKNLKTKDCLYEIRSLEEDYEIIEMKKPNKTKDYLYSDKTVIYNGTIKCIIKEGNNYFVNWYREEKGKPMTHKIFKKNNNIQSLNDYFINLYNRKYIQN